MAHWMRVGFVHGVMNTDNMSILGLTIDYGPYGWLDDFDPDWTPNTTDAGERRYRFGNQPRVAKWNLIKLAEALHPLIGSIPPLEEALVAYTETYEAEESRLFAAKLGLTRADKPLVDELFEVLALVETDMTLFFRGLANVPVQLDPASEIHPRKHCWRRWPVRTTRPTLSPARPGRGPSPGFVATAPASGKTRSRRRQGGRPRSASSAWTPSIQSTSSATAWPSWPSTPPKRATPRWCSSCSSSCATLTTSSPRASASPPGAPTGPAIAPAARCSPAAPERRPLSVCAAGLSDSRFRSSNGDEPAIREGGGRI